MELITAKNSMTGLYWDGMAFRSETPVIPLTPGYVRQLALVWANVVKATWKTDGPIQVKISDLVLRDTISILRPGQHPYEYGTVTNIAQGEVHVARPYIHTSDFAHIGGVIRYMGLEEFTLQISDNRPVWLVAREDEPR